jgi:hypothetical protein
MTKSQPASAAAIASSTDPACQATSALPLRRARCTSAGSGWLQNT